MVYSKVFVYTVSIEHIKMGENKCAGVLTQIKDMMTSQYTTTDDIIDACTI